MDTEVTRTENRSAVDVIEEFAYRCEDLKLDYLELMTAGYTDSFFADGLEVSAAEYDAFMAKVEALYAMEDEVLAAFEQLTLDPGFQARALRELYADGLGSKLRGWFGRHTWFGNASRRDIVVTLSQMGSADLNTVWSKIQGTEYAHGATGFNAWLTKLQNKELDGYAGEIHEYLLDNVEDSDGFAFYKNTANQEGADRVHVALRTGATAINATVEAIKVAASATIPGVGTGIAIIDKVQKLDEYKDKIAAGDIGAVVKDYIKDKLGEAGAGVAKNVLGDNVYSTYENLKGAYDNIDSVVGKLKAGESVGSGRGAVTVVDTGASSSGTSDDEEKRSLVVLQKKTAADDPAPEQLLPDDTTTQTLTIRTGDGDVDVDVEDYVGEEGIPETESIEAIFGLVPDQPVEDSDNGVEDHSMAVPAGDYELTVVDGDGNVAAGTELTVAEDAVTPAAVETDEVLSDPVPDSELEFLVEVTPGTAAVEDEVAVVVSAPATAVPPLNITVLNPGGLLSHGAVVTDQDLFYTEDAYGTQFTFTATAEGSYGIAIWIEDALGMVHSVGANAVFNDAPVDPTPSATSATYRAHDAFTTDPGTEDAIFWDITVTVTMEEDGTLSGTVTGTGAGVGAPSASPISNGTFSGTWGGGTFQAYGSFVIEGTTIEFGYAGTFTSLDQETVEGYLESTDGTLTSFTASRI